MKHLLRLTTIIFTFLVISSCNTYKKKVQEPKGHHAEQIGKKDCSNVHWSHHEGENGPENWKNLCDGFSDCGKSSQSPINIVTSTISKVDTLEAIKFNYGKSGVEIINNGHTVQFNITGDNYITINGTVYKLLQFHYHTKSEHTINGNYYPIEVHFVHKNSDTNYAVVSMLFQEGKSNELLENYLNKFPSSKGTFKSEEMIDLLNLFPINKSYYNYKGSLTTPPCSEVVNWYVLKTPITASKQQIKLFSKILNNNYRPVQPLNSRTIQVYNQ